MLSLAQTSRQNFQRRFLGGAHEVLFEQKIGGLWSGYTDTYIRAYVKGDLDLTNRLLPVKFIGLKGDGVRGEIIEESKKEKRDAC